MTRQKKQQLTLLAFLRAMMDALLAAIFSLLLFVLILLSLLFLFLTLPPRGPMTSGLSPYAPLPALTFFSRSLSRLASRSWPAWQRRCERAIEMRSEAGDAEALRLLALRSADVFTDPIADDQLHVQ